jgi:predicted transcriptional regulator YheO
MIYIELFSMRYNVLFVHKKMSLLCVNLHVSTLIHLDTLFFFFLTKTAASEKEDRDRAIWVKENHPTENLTKKVSHSLAQHSNPNSC